MEIKREIYGADFGESKVCIHITEFGVVANDKTLTIPRQRILDFIATAKELGFNVSKI